MSKEEQRAWDRLEAELESERVRAPFIVKWSGVESHLAHEKWWANCGPHTLGAITGKTLDEVKAHLVGYKGWMNPTMIGEALARMGIRYSLRKGLKTSDLCEGINRIQWEGKWLDPGVPAAVAYHHTHWVAHCQGWVLCTMMCAVEWKPIEEWKAWLLSRNSPWHATHHYTFPVTPAKV